MEQLDWAIKLFIDHRALVPAITLAGAVDELLGARLGDKSAFRMADRHFKSLGHTVDLNDLRNWLKHDSGDERIVTDMEAYAIFMFLRIGANIHQLGLPLTDEGRRFSEWLEKHWDYVMDGK